VYNCAGEEGLSQEVRGGGGKEVSEGVESTSAGVREVYCAMVWGEGIEQEAKRNSGEA